MTSTRSGNTSNDQGYSHRHKEDRSYFAKIPTGLLRDAGDDNSLFPKASLYCVQLSVGASLKGYTIIKIRQLDNSQPEDGAVT